MHALIELIVGLVAMLAAATLAPFGVELRPPVSNDREVHRVSDCDERPQARQQLASHQNC